MSRFKAPLALLALTVALTPTLTGGQGLRTWRIVLSSHPEPLFYRAAGIAVGGSNNIFVADSGDHRVKKFSPSGTPLAVWGTDTPGTGRFAGPFGVAVDSWGTVYVADTEVVKLSTTGRPVARWRVPAPGLASGIAVDGRRNVYVLSVVRTGYYRTITSMSVTRFAPSGEARAVWSQAIPSAAGNQLFSASMAMAGDGTVLLSVEGQTFCHSCDGTYDQLWTISPAGKKAWAVATGIGGGGVAVDPSANVYLGAGGRVVELGAAGQALGSWGVTGCGPARLGSDLHLAYHAGGIYVADTQQEAGLFSGVIHVLSPVTGQLARFGRCPAPGPVHVASAPILGADDTLYLDFQGHIDRYDLSGTTRGGFDVPPSYPPGLVAADRRGNLYISDVQRSILTVVSPTGTMLARMTPIAFTSLVVDPSGVLYGLSMQSPGWVSVLKPVDLFNGWGTFQTPRVLARWPLWAYAPHSSGLLPEGIALDRRGALYVADTRHGYIQKFSHAGRLLGVWGNGQGSRPGQFSNPAGVAVDSHGNVYVTDTGNSRIQELNPRGASVQVWGRQGTAPGQFNRPAGIAIDRHDAVYVQDGNARIVTLAGGDNTQTPLS